MVKFTETEPFEHQLMDIIDCLRTPEANVGLGKLPKWSLCLADYIMMSPTLFSHLHRRGIHTYLWVLNSEEEYARYSFHDFPWQPNTLMNPIHRAFSLGATGVMTDYPSRLQKLLAKKAK